MSPLQLDKERATPRLLTPQERSALPPKKAATILKHTLTHVSTKVSVSWGWYNNDPSQGVVEWTFGNGDTVQHSVVLLRNGYYFGGAFWPIYVANSGFAVDWATALTPLTDNGVANNSKPICLADVASGNRSVNFAITLGPGESWSVLEGGFSTSMTPSGITLYEVTLEKSGSFCIGYDSQRVADWDAQTGTTLQGYSPNPSTVDTIEISVESDAPYDVLPFNDSYADGPCASPGPSPTPCTQYLDQVIADVEGGKEGAAIGDLESFIECLFTSGLLRDVKGAAGRIKVTVEKHL